MQRIGSWLFGVVVVQGVALALLAAILPNFSTDGFDSLLVATLVISACQAIAWPVFYWVARLVHPLLFPILDLLFRRLHNLVRRPDRRPRSAPHEFMVRTVWAGLWIALGSVFVDTIYGAIFTATDERLYNQFVTRPLRRAFRHVRHSDEPGVLFLEIDGLAAPILQQAIDGGMPTMKRWLDPAVTG